MRKCFLLILSLCVVCAVLLSACGGGDASQNADSSMEPVTDSSGTITGYERYSHNSEGLVSRIDYFTADNIYDHYVIYEYDSKGRVVLETTYSANGVGQYFYDYRYDDDGNYEKVTYATQNDGYTVTLYAEGMENEKFHYDNKGNLLSHQEMQNGEWIETPYDEETENISETIE